MSDSDWLRLINRRAAAREQFPAGAKVLRERPGSETDRAQQAIHAAHNQSAASTASRSWLQRELDHLAAEADADRFIAERKRARRHLDAAHHMRRSRAQAWATAHDQERKSA